MDASQRINPGHRKVRKFFRIAGPIILLIGVVMLIAGIIDSFGSHGRLGPHPLMWCIFVGMPLIFVGSVMSMLGFMGRIARYHAQEAAPVAIDTFNEVADGVGPGVRTVAGAIREELSGKPQQETACPKCRAANDFGSKFCDQCGAALPMPMVCGGCGAENEAGSRFCDQCGKPISARA